MLLQFPQPNGPTESSMEAALILSFSAAILLISTSFAAASPLLLLGIHPLDENYFSSEFINCKDGSKSFNRARLNDDFCDCLDGTDEPGTSACPAGKFYCRNFGSMPLFLFSSHVNDHICDCCDGSDEYDGTVHCPNTCVMGGNFAYGGRDRKVSVGKSVERSMVTNVDNVYWKEGKSGLKLDDLLEKLKGLRMLIILQVGLISCVVVYRLCQRRSKSRRRRRR